MPCLRRVSLPMKISASRYSASTCCGVGSVVGAGELEHLVERARLLGGVAERGRDAGLRVERLGELLAEDLDAAIQVRRAAQVVRVGLERLAGAHQDVRDQRRIVLAAQPVDDRLDRLDELLGGAVALREDPRAIVQIEPGRDRVDRLDQRVERLGAAVELLVERLGHVAEQASLAVGSGLVASRFSRTSSSSSPSPCASRLAAQPADARHRTGSPISIADSSSSLA